MPHIYKETNKKRNPIGKNNNEMESNTIKVTKQNTRKAALYKQARMKS